MIWLWLQSGANQAPDNNKVKEAKSQTVSPGQTEKRVGKKYLLVKKERKASYQLGKASANMQVPSSKFWKQELKI